MRPFLYAVDFAVKGLLRQKTKNLSIVALFGLIVFLFSGIDFMSNALYQETLKALDFQPSLIIQDVRAGRQVPISLNDVEAIGRIPGVSSVKGRVWGYYFDPFTGANYTIVGNSENLTELWDLRAILLEPASSDSGTELIKNGEALVGDGVAKIRRTRVGGILNFQDYVGHPVPLKVRGTFSSRVSLWTHDLILLTEEDARRLFGLAPGTAWDIAVDVPNEFEVPKVGEKILRINPGARVIATNQLKRTYGSSYGFRSGVVLSNMTCLLAFLILAYDRVASLSQEEQREIAVLKAIGWQTGNVIRLSMLQSLILSLTGFLVGIVASYFHVFVVGAPLLRIVFAGWSVLYPPHPIPPSFDMSKVFGLMFLTVVPYISVGILPVWRASVRDPEEVFRGVSIITMESVTKVYNQGRPNEFVALSEISVEISTGECTILAGPSGSGKTTLLSLVGLMSRPSSGRITILGRETTLLSENFRTLFRRRHMGFIFQHFQLIADLTVKDNLDLVLYPEGKPLDKIRERRTSLLERFGLIVKSSEKAAVLSGGEKQRLAIARALMNDPEILLIDEPTAHLDTTLSHQVIDLFRDLKSERKTLVIASHDPLVLTSGLAEKVIHLRDGRIIG